MRLILIRYFRYIKTTQYSKRYYTSVFCGHSPGLLAIAPFSTTTLLS
jgi:hypothetical protein